MTSHTPMPKISRLDVTETGARCRWTSEEKQRIQLMALGGAAIPRASPKGYFLSPAWRDSSERPLPSSTQRQASFEEQGLSGDEGRSGAAKPERSGGHIFGLA